MNVASKRPWGKLFPVSRKGGHQSPNISRNGNSLPPSGDGFLRKMALERVSVFSLHILLAYPDNPSLDLLFDYMLNYFNAVPMILREEFV